MVATPPDGALGHASLAVASMLAVLAAAIAAGVSLGLRSSNPASTMGIAVVRSNGSVQVLDPNNGAVERQLVGPSPVDSQGHALSGPGAIAVGGDKVFVEYYGGEKAFQPVIVSVPLSGGALTPVASGEYSTVSSDGSRLAFVTFSRTGERIVVKDLSSGSEHTVWSSATSAPGSAADVALVNGLAWSRDDELAVAQTSVQLPDTINPGHPSHPDFASTVLLFGLTSPPSPSNPRSVGPKGTSDPSASWTDPQFVGPDTLAVLASDSTTRCTGGPVSLRIDTSTGATTTDVNLPPRTDHVLYDDDGHVIAYIEDPDLCHPPSTSQPPSTTTTTTPPMPSLLGASASHITTHLVGTSTTGSASATFVRADLELYADHGGNHRKLADHVAGAVALP